MCVVKKNNNRVYREMFAQIIFHTWPMLNFFVHFKIGKFLFKPVQKGQKQLHVFILKINAGSANNANLKVTQKCLCLQ